MRGWKVVAASALALLAVGAGVARAEFDSDPEETCRTIHAFEEGPSLDAVRAALDRAGTHGWTRLDLRVSVETTQPTDEAGNLIRVPPGSAAAAPSVGGTLSPEIARAIAESSKMTKIRALAFDDYRLTAESARVLARSRHFGAVESLSLPETGVTAAVLHELLAPGAFPALQVLDLARNRLRPGDLRELAARLADRRIRRLALGRRADWSDLLRGGETGKPALARSAASAEALAQIAATPGLATLDLAEEPLGFIELEALLKVARNEPLQILTGASFGKLSSKQLEALAALDPEGRITLSIVDNTTSPSVLRALDRSRLLAKAFALEVVCGDACARVISGSTNAARLRELTFDCNEGTAFTHKTAEALAKGVALGALRKVALLNDVELCQARGIGLTGLRALIKAPFAGQLESLRLEDQNLEPPAYVELARAESLGALKELDASEWEPFLKKEVARLFFHDGALARHVEVLRFQSEGAIGVANFPAVVDVPKLRVLELSPAVGSREEWLQLTRSPGLRKLQVLATDGLTDEDARAVERNLRPDGCVR